MTFVVLALHFADALSHLGGGLGCDPGGDHRGHRPIDVARRHRLLLRIPDGKELGRGIGFRDGRSGEEQERGNPVRIESGDAEGDRAAEGAADEGRPLDPEAVHRLHHVLPMRHRPGVRNGLPEPRQVHGHHPVPRRQRLQVLVPHPAIGDPRVQQQDRGSLTLLAVGELHRQTS